MGLLKILRLRSEAEIPEDISASKIDAEGFQSLDNINILLVEDMRSDAELLLHILRKVPPIKRPELTHCIRLSEGLEALKTKKYDAVLLDLSLPDSLGLQTIETLRAQNPTIPIVVLTGLDDQEIGLSAVRAGAQDYIVKSSFLDGDKVLNSVKFAIERQFQLLEAKTVKPNANHTADYDPLTGLPHFSLYQDRLNRALSEAGDGRKVMVAHISLEDFKSVAKVFGEFTGDSLLKSVAARLQGRTRVEDTVCRAGNDEFLLLFPKISTDSGHFVIARRIIALFKEPFRIDDHKFILHANLGMSMSPEDGTTSDDLISSAKSMNNFFNGKIEEV